MAASESHLDGKVILHAGDCLDVMPTLAANSIDACVCDPPYGLGFMGKAWDHGVPGVPYWKAVYRVLKPGGHLVAFGGTRTFGRMHVAIEDAGFEIRDMLSWLYGSGFPKSLDVSKAIDKAVGAEREQVGTKRITGRNGDAFGYGPEQHQTRFAAGDIAITAPATDEAKQWSGFGTALKPACEPIVLARKPLIGTVAENVLKHGTGAINIDACRVATGEKIEPFGSPKRSVGGIMNGTAAPREQFTQDPQGRWPANVIHDGSDEVVGAFPESESGISVTRNGGGRKIGGDGIYGGSKPQTGLPDSGYTDSGSAARFFYQVENDALCGICGLPYKPEFASIFSCDASNAELNSRTESIPLGASVRSDAVGLPAPESVDKSPPSNGSASGVANHSSQCRPPKVGSAQESVQNSPLSKTVQNVKSAASLCSLCATDIAHALVAVRQARNPASIQFKDFIDGRNAPILIQHLVLYVAGREDTDIILTTQSLKQLFGSVFHAIEKFTPPITDAPKESNGKSARFWYGSKAASDDRLGSKHPTVKPLDLMQWLVRLVTPPGGLVLDPFAGTGTTGEAAWREGMRAILIEREPEYQNDIRRRMAHALAGPGERKRTIAKVKHGDKPLDEGLFA